MLARLEKWSFTVDGANATTGQLTIQGVTAGRMV